MPIIGIRDPDLDAKKFDLTDFKRWWNILKMVALESAGNSGPEFITP